jgi:hypothetical protein
MIASAETEWPILLQHRKPPSLLRICAQSAGLQQFSYEILPLKSRVLQRFETLSAILFQFQRRRLGRNEMTALKYRAFLSYSHRDTAWAKRLHKALESYRIDKDLIGRETQHGPIPKTLRPIFRDREDFSAGHSLTEQTLAALEASQFLIVICSPNAAQSAYVNEEILRFKALGGAARVIPLIVEGVPGDAARECFPRALRFKVGADGELTDQHEEPIAADARPQGDGKEIAKQKIVAGLLGVGLDEIAQRAERARKRRNRLRFGMATAAAIVFVIGFIGWSWAVGFSSRLDSSQTIGMETDAASMCQNANAQAVKDSVPEARRIAFAVKCVRVLSYNMGDLANDARVPRAFIWSFESDVAVLQKFADDGKLTPEQADVLAKGEALVAHMKLLCGSQNDDAGKDDLGFSC